MNQTINISGQDYIIVSKKEFTHKDSKRIALSLRKPKGKKLFEAVIYENGQISEVI